MALWTKLFSHGKDRGLRCGKCDQPLQRDVSAGATQSSDPFADAVGHAGALMATPAYTCKKCGAVLCTGCLPLDGSLSCPKCGSTEMRQWVDNDAVEVGDVEATTRAACRRMTEALLPICLIGLVALGATLLARRGESNLRLLRSQYEMEIEQLVAANQRQMENGLAKHRKRMADNELISGNRARQAHEQEWKRRCEYDPAFAETTREKTILDISSLAKDKSLPASILLQRIATLAAPSKSKVQVISYDGGFRLAVTFDMSAMTSGEVGSRTKHRSIGSLKREVIEIISRVARDMYDHCGHNGIESISIACTHGVQKSETRLPSVSERFKPSGTLMPGDMSRARDVIQDINRRLIQDMNKRAQPSPDAVRSSPADRIVTETIYKCAITRADAKKVPDWRRVPLHQVADMLRVEHDEFPYLTIVETTIPSFRW